MEAETQLFPGVPCFVDGDPGASGFYELQLPDGFRRVKSEANCRCRVAEGAAVADPCLLVRVLATHRNESPYLSVAVAGQPIGVQPIFSYGTHFFRLPSALLKNLSAGGSLAVRLSTLGAPIESTPRDSRETGLAIYEVRLIDLNTDDFPERHEFLEQIKIFQPAGGTIAEILHGHTFRPADRLLDIGCGQGWTTVLLAGFSSARVWGVDLYDYSHPGRRSFKAELQERFDRHRPALQRVARFEPLADREILEQVISRCNFLSTSAEELLLPDNTFDFVFSLNAFEHILRPDRAVAEIRRVLRPGGRALLVFSPLYYCDAGSHLPPCVGYNRPWSHLVMSRDEIKEGIRSSGGITNEVDAILNSLNGWRPAQFIDAFEGSGLGILAHELRKGFVLPGSEQSTEFAELLHRFSRDDLTTISMVWHLEKEGGRHWNSRAPWLSKIRFW